MKDKERAEAKKKAEDKNTVKLPQKELETNNLVVTRSYGTRQQPPINATGKGTHKPHRHVHHEADRQPLYPFFNASWSGAEASFQILLYFSSLFHNIDFFLCLVGGFTLFVSGGRYGRGENMQGFW